MKKITINKIILYLLNNRKFKFLSDKTFIKLEYRLYFNKKLNLNNPQTFNEKIQWLKLNDRKDIYTKMVDKYTAKECVKQIMGDDIIIKTYGVWDKFEDIDFNILPNKFVLKPTHTSGDVFICEDKNNIDKNKLENQVRKWLKREYYYLHREWPYKNIKPRIIAEEYISNKDKTGLIDYKFYCFNGKSEYTMLCTDRESGMAKFYYVDRNGNFIKEMSYDGMKLKDESKLIIPDNLSEMFEIAEKLTQGLMFCRLDMYNVDGKIYFGEYTFYPSSGYDNTRIKKCEEYLDKSLKIDIKEN